ncbi:hypothetical protein IQ07DRAFT_596649 [Pyrenochaeta sp. DS3sAY3a]|nr:hypothetical protein IQ07DRAFT_596649 [Pyrenochaeta sp. DS3sAY3a]
MAPVNHQRRLTLLPALPSKGASNQPAPAQPVANQRTRRNASPAVVIKKKGPAPSHAKTQAGTSSSNPVHISEEESNSPSDNESDSSGDSESSEEYDGPALRRITLLAGLPFPGASTVPLPPVSTSHASQRQPSTHQAAGSSTPTEEESILQSVEQPEPTVQPSNRTGYIVKTDSDEGASLQRAASVGASPVGMTAETFRLSGASLTSHDELYAEPSPTPAATPTPAPRRQRQHPRLAPRPAAPNNGGAGNRQGMARGPIATKMPRQAIASNSPRKAVATKSPRKTVATKMPRRTIATKSPRRPPCGQSTTASNLPPQINVEPPQINFGSAPTPTPFTRPPQINAVANPTNRPIPHVNALPPRANLAPPPINIGVSEASFVVPQTNFAPPRVNAAPSQSTNGFVTGPIQWSQMTPVQNIGHIQQHTGYQIFGAPVQTQQHTAFPGMMGVQTPYVDPNIQPSANNPFGFTVEDMAADYANLQSEMGVMQNAAQQNVGTAGFQHQQPGNTLGTNTGRPIQQFWSGTVAFRPEEIQVAAATSPREPRLMFEHEWAQRNGVNLTDVDIDPSRTRNTVLMFNDRVTLYNDPTYVSSVRQEWNMPIPTNHHADMPNMFAAGGYQNPHAGGYGHANVQVPAEDAAGPSGTQKRKIKTSKRKSNTNEGAEDIDEAFFGTLTPVKE